MGWNVDQIDSWSTLFYSHVCYQTDACIVQEDQSSQAEVGDTPWCACSATVGHTVLHMAPVVPSTVVHRQRYRHTRSQITATHISSHHQCEQGVALVDFFGSREPTLSRIRSRPALIQKSASQWHFPLYKSHYELHNRQKKVLRSIQY